MTKWILKLTALTLIVLFSVPRHVTEASKLDRSGQTSRESIINAGIEILLRATVTSGAQIMDIRPNMEFSKAHVPGARSFQIDQVKRLEESELTILRASPIVILYGTSGADTSAFQAAEALAVRLHRQIYVYTGGWAEWTGLLANVR